MLKRLTRASKKENIALCEESLKFTLNLSTSTQKKQNKLVLHFDVNETIMIGDEAGGDTFTDSLNKIIGKSALVKRKQVGGSDTTFSEWKHWRWHDGSVLDPNASETPELVFDWNRKPGLESYHNMKYTHKEFNAKIFTHKGQPGFVYNNLMTKLQSVMTIPKSIRPIDERLTLDGSNYFILPSFFETLAQIDRQKRDVVVVIRTFGSDGFRVANAINAWVEGKHPLFKGRTFSSFRVDLKRNMFVGRYDKTDKSFKVRYFEGDDDKNVFDEKEVVMKLLSGSMGKVQIIQDDYHWWNENHYIPGAGKPLWLSLDRPHTHHIFFDDHINNDADDSIVCVRYREHSKQNFMSLSGEKIRQQHGTFIVRVPTVQAVLDRSFFLKKIGECEANFKKMFALPWKLRTNCFVSK